jgi:CheY-like chemotaxis protein
MARILILNDEPDLLEVTSLVLNDLGHSVETISDGVEVVETARRFDPDLILLDWVMPGLQGDEVFFMLRRDLERRVPVVLMSALEDGAERAKIIGTDAFLPKPFDARQLQDTVLRALEDGVQDSR